MIWFYFVAMLLVSYLTISWGTVLVTPSGMERVRVDMFQSMRNYDPDSQDVTTTGVTEAWDRLQSQVPRQGHHLLHLRCLCGCEAWVGRLGSWAREL